MTKVRPIAPLVPLLLAPLLLSCGIPFGEDRVLGVVAFYDDPVVIQVPDTAFVSVPFGISVRTYGGGCERMGPTEVRVQGQLALVRPYDYTETGIGIACPSILRSFDHEATVTFQASGAAVVRVHGREEPSGQIREFAIAVWVR